MDPDDARQVYFRSRIDDAPLMKKVLAVMPGGQKFLEHLLWTNAALDADGSLAAFYAPLPEKGKFNVTGFLPLSGAPAVEKVGDFCRLPVTCHRILALDPFRGEEDFFRALSPKNRKKIRWLRNALPEAGCRIVPMTDDRDFPLFEALYAAQFPKYPVGCPANQALRLMYRELFRLNRAGCFMLLSDAGEVLAAALGFFGGGGYFFTHLTRSRSAYDKFSPGYFLAYRLIVSIITGHPETRFFYMGPGDYDYKRAFLGESFPVYRYERRSWRNLPGLIRLHFRCRKERKRYRGDHP